MILSVNGCLKQKMNIITSKKVGFIDGLDGNKVECLNHLKYTDGKLQKTLTKFVDSNH